MDVAGASRRCRPGAQAAGHALWRAAAACGHRARALANDPPLLLADEPTGNLDSSTAEAVVALFAQLAQQGKTLPIVSHDQRVAASAQRVVELRDGCVLSDSGAAT